MLLLDHCDRVPVPVPLIVILRLLNMHVSGAVWSYEPQNVSYILTLTKRHRKLHTEWSVRGDIWPAAPTLTPDLSLQPLTLYIHHASLALCVCLPASLTVIRICGTLNLNS